MPLNKRLKRNNFYPTFKNVKNGNRLFQEKGIIMDKILVLDTETTGLDDNAEILQISAMWGDEVEAINQYVRPVHTVSWPGAERVNHISPEMVANKPTMFELKTKIEKLLNETDIVVGYNLRFDLRMLELNGVKLPFDKTRYVDIMVPFAIVFGEWSDYFQDYKWQKLITCAHYYGYKGDGWHDSMACTSCIVLL